MDVNFYGVCRVTQAVIPQMRAARAGRIISVTSIGGLIGQPFNDAYCAAKFAVEGLMESLAPVLRRFGIHVSLIEPGPIHTEFVANVDPSVQALNQRVGPDDEYRPLIDAYRRATQEVFASFGPPVASGFAACPRADQAQVRRAELLPRYPPLCAGSVRTQRN